MIGMGSKVVCKQSYIYICSRINMFMRIHAYIYYKYIDIQVYIDLIIKIHTYMSTFIYT
jgi:hypothetical protein